MLVMHYNGPLSTQSFPLWLLREQSKYMGVDEKESRSEKGKKKVFTALGLAFEDEEISKLLWMCFIVLSLSHSVVLSFSPLTL